MDPDLFDFSTPLRSDLQEINFLSSLNDQQSSLDPRVEARKYALGFIGNSNSSLSLERFRELNMSRREEKIMIKKLVFFSLIVSDSVVAEVLKEVGFEGELDLDNEVSITLASSSIIYGSGECMLDSKTFR